MGEARTEIRTAWSIIVFTTLAGAGQGLFLALFAADLAGRAARHFLFIGSALAALLCVAGLVSRLPGERIALCAFIAAVAGYSAAELFSLRAEARVIGVVAVLLCLALFLRQWRSPLTCLSFLALGCASGATAAAALAAELQPALLAPYTALAIALALLAFVIRSAGLFHGRAPAAVAAVRVAFLVLGFPLPAFLLYAGQPAIAFLVQYAGLLAERWLFFVDAQALA